MVDIIIPVYNVAQYLRQCLDSVLNQTFGNTHVIIVDDGSTDGSESICDGYATYQNVTVIHQPNGGLSAARNTGLEYAYGEYVMFVDSDDWIEPNTVESLVVNLVDYSGDISCCGFVMEYSDGAHVKKAQRGVNKVALNREEALDEVLSKRTIGYATWGKLYKRCLFENIKFPVGKIHEDIDVTPKVFLKCNTIITTNEVLFHYRQRYRSLSRNEYKKSNYDLYHFTFNNRYIIDLYPSLRDAYFASYYTTCKDLISLFKSHESKKIFHSDYSLYRREIWQNIGDILLNKRLTTKSKLSILSALLPFREHLRNLF